MSADKSKRLLWRIPFLAFLIIGTVLIIRQQQTIPYQHNTGFIFGTIFNITYQNDDDLNNEIVDELNKVDASLSIFNKESIISKINRNVDVMPNEMFKEVFSLAENISMETDGAFDITVAPMVNEWGFGFKKGVPPTKLIIDSLKTIVGYKKVKLENDRIKKSDSRIMLDCSAIAKGYGCDVVARYLRTKGIKNFMIEIGGEIVTSGINDKRVPWRIGITKPTDGSLNVNEEIQTVLSITDISIATSGNYRNFYYKGGRKYAHTIDPKTGYPVQHNILSSTVIASNCATADAYATSFMVLGLDGAQKILKKHPELMAYFIYSGKNGKNKVWYSSSMKGKIIN